LPSPSAIALSAATISATKSTISAELPGSEVTADSAFHSAFEPATTPDQHHSSIS
jgi:hypothetical protein